MLSGRRGQKPTLTSGLLYAFLIATFLFLIPSVSAADFNHSSTVSGTFDTSNNLKMPLFIVLGVVTLLLLAMGFAGHQLFGVVGAVLMFFLAFMVLDGSLAVKDGEVSIYDNETGTTTVDYQYEAWDYGNHELVGWLMAILSVVTFTIFLMGGDH